MIRKYAKAQIIDGLGKNNLFLEVNFDESNMDLVKITLGDNTAVIKRDDLWNFVFSIVEADKQQKMIPLKKEDFTVYDRQHHVKVEKDLKAGDEVIVNCKLDVTQRVEEHLRKEFEEKNKKIVSPYNDNVL